MTRACSDSSVLYEPVTARERTAETAPGQMLLCQLLNASLILADDWDRLSKADRDQLYDEEQVEQLVERLVELRLITPYQAERISHDKLYGLVLGNYRVLDRLGSGGMGIVFKGEHIRLRRLVAIKVLPMYQRDQSIKNLLRFYAEVQAVAKLQHPNIVNALDAGEVPSPGSNSPALHYYVMEYVDGKNLEDHVLDEGPMPPADACGLMHQVASALAEAHKQNLVHRDVKPPNILLTSAGQAKLLDFGLVRSFGHRMTEPGTVLGTVDYMAPEQAQDASTVDIRADVFGLGATLFWCLAGRPPFKPTGNLAQELLARRTQSAPPIRSVRPEIDSELEAVVCRMMAPDPNDRYPTPSAVMQALLPFLKPQERVQMVLPAGSSHHLPAVPTAQSPELPASCPKVHHALIIDDEAAIRKFCRFALKAEGVVCDEAEDGPSGLAALGAKSYDLVILDWAMPGMTGLDVARRIRDNPPSPHVKILMLSGHATSDDLARVLLTGADDFLAKPFSVVQLVARAKAALRVKDAQDRAELLNQRLLSLNHQVGENLSARDNDLVHARKAMVLAMARLVSHRDANRSSGAQRLQRYCRALAEQAACSPAFAPQIDAEFIQNLEVCAPLHDIGKVGLPDHILFKDGRLEPEERIIMQTHTVIGGDTLAEVTRQHGAAVSFLRMAADIARHHHERYDGTGYPDRLAGENIPLAARIVTLCDVYDALRCRRMYKPALSHVAAMQVMLEASHGQFDPGLLQAFQRCAGDFERIYKDTPE
jgi:response regulator RpfG family c-di-GMP phosphodiesterase